VRSNHAKQTKAGILWGRLGQDCCCSAERSSEGGKKGGKGDQGGRGGVDTTNGRGNCGWGMGKKYLPNKRSPEGVDWRKKWREPLRENRQIARGEACEKGGCTNRFPRPTKENTKSLQREGSRGSRHSVWWERIVIAKQCARDGTPQTNTRGREERVYNFLKGTYSKKKKGGTQEKDFKTSF